MSGRVGEATGNEAGQGAAKRLEVAVGVVIRRDGRVRPEWSDQGEQSGGEGK